jgi:D-alanine-D-alanine ligase
MKVAVLLGGISAERDVSLSTGRGVLSALGEVGHEAVAVEVGEDLAATIAALRQARPDVVFNALHGRFGEDGCIQGVLDWMGLPYTHSGVRASAIAMDKAAAKEVFRAAGLPVATHKVVTPEELAEADPLPLPYVVKPVDEGSSVGVFVLRDGDNRRREIALNWRHGRRIMAEDFIPGRELTVAVLRDRALGVTEIVTRHAFYDYDAKYADGGSHHVLPAAIPSAVAERAMQVALAAHRALGCRGASRADFRYDEATDRLALLEVNTQPGMTPTSLLPEQAAHAGIAFPALCDLLLREARHGA